MRGYNQAQKKKLVLDSGVDQITLFLEDNPMILNQVTDTRKETHAGISRIEVSTGDLAWLWLGFLGEVVERA